jgi:FkbM family methyltransferase
VFGVRVDLDLADYVQRMMYLGWREETALAIRRLSPGGVCVDVGANAGYFTLLAASRVGPTGRVVAFEPDAVLAEKLTATVRANRLDTAAVIPAALGRVAGELPLHIPPPSVGNRAGKFVGVSGWEVVGVQVHTLESVLRELDLLRFDLLKLDVQGFEVEVLAGATDSLRIGRILAVMCEFDCWLLEASVRSVGSAMANGQLEWL